MTSPALARQEKAHLSSHRPAKTTRFSSGTVKLPSFSDPSLVIASSRRRVVASSRRRVVATEDIAAQGRLLRRVAETVDGGVLPAVVDEIYAGTLG
jgi:hypothetical protein